MPLVVKIDHVSFDALCISQHNPAAWTPGPSTCGEEDVYDRNAQEMRLLEKLAFLQTARVGHR